MGRQSPYTRQASLPRLRLFQEEIGLKDKQSLEQPAPLRHTHTHGAFKQNPVRLFIKGQCTTSGAGGEDGVRSQLEACRDPFAAPCSSTSEMHLCFPVPWAHLGVGRRSQDRGLGLKKTPSPPPGGQHPACRAVFPRAAPCSPGVGSKSAHGKE